MKLRLLLLILLTAGAVQAAEPLSLRQCETDALQSSAQLKELQARADSARAEAQASAASLYPSLSLDAKGSWVSDIPRLTLGNTSLDFGDNWGYAAGPTLSYVLFDKGGRSSVRRAAQRAWSAREQEAAFARKQILLQVRQAYFQVQYLLQHLVLLSGQLDVGRKQLTDVLSAYQAGTKSQLDVSMAQKQVLQTQASISNARGHLAKQLRNLFQLTGTDYGIDPVYPTDVRLQNAQLDGHTTAVLQTDALDTTLQQFRPYQQDEFDDNSPKLAALQDMAHYYQYLSASYQAALYPRVSISGGAYLEYPNGALREHVFLGRAGAAVSVPLFEGGQDRRRAQAQQALADATRYSLQDTRETLQTLFYTAQDRLYALSVQEETLRRMIEEAQKAARLTYQAYQAGAVTFFEVERANLALLESRLALADVQVESLNHLAVLHSLSKENI